MTQYAFAVTPDPTAYEEVRRELRGMERLMKDLLMTNTDTTVHADMLLGALRVNLETLEQLRLGDAGQATLERCVALMDKLQPRVEALELIAKARLG